MYKLRLQNAEGKELEFNKLGGPYTITEISGLSPAKATINTSASALLDGAKFNSSKVNMRTLNLAFAIEKDAEASRLNAYAVLQPKRPITVYYSSPRLNVYIEGYVESFNVTHFARKQVATVSIVCPFPYFKGMQLMVNELSVVHSLFHFPFASLAEPELVFGYLDPLTSIVVDNNGGIECGLTFELHVMDTLSTPKIYNYQTGEFMQLNISLQTGDVVTIITDKGNKSITLLRNGTKTNIFNCLSLNSTWLLLEPEGSAFVYEVGSGEASDLFVTISHRDLYEGV